MTYLFRTYFHLKCIWKDCSIQIHVVPSFKDSACENASSVRIGLNFFKLQREYITTVDSRYLDPSYLDPITYVELISKSRLFSLCIYCISASRMSNYFYVDISAISSVILVPKYIFHSFYYRLSRTRTMTKEKNVRCGAAGLSVNENHNRPLINKSIF